MTEQSCVYGGEELAYGQDNCMTSQVKGTGRFMYLMLLVQGRSMVLSLHLSQCPRKGDKALPEFQCQYLVYAISRRTVSAHAEGLFFTV